MKLLEETLQVLEQNNLTEKDIMWLGCGEFRISWDNFKEVANKNYDSGFGASEVATDLVIVGKNWYMTRGEYDGSEWWDFNTAPKKPKEIKNIKKVIGGCWENLNDLNPK